MPSFDMVSKINIQEIENSVNMVNRDIVNRFDFRGSNTKLTFNIQHYNDTIRLFDITVWVFTLIQNLQSKPNKRNSLGLK